MGKEYLLKAKEILVTVSSFCIPIITLVTAYSLYKNNIYNPTKDIKIVNVDYNNGTAVIEYSNMFNKTETISIVGDEAFSLTGNWGIKIGTSNGNYNNITLLQNGLVYAYLDIKK